MQSKDGYLWEAYYDEERNLYTARVGGNSIVLYEINKEIFDGLKDGMEFEAQRLICEGRKLYMRINDQCGPPYTVVLDEDYLKLCPWAKDTVPEEDVWPVEMTDAVVEVLDSQENNREQRRKKREEREKKNETDSQL